MRIGLANRLQRYERIKTMQKKKLQDICSLPVLTAGEAINFLGWQYTKDGTRYDDIKCCGSLVACSGYFGGTEDLECEICGKRMHDLLGVTHVSNSACTILFPSEFDLSDDKHWIAILPK